MDRTSICIRGLMTCLLFSLILTNIQADDKGVFDRKVQLIKSRGTVYELLKNLSGQTDYLFIYDSQVVDNDRVVKIPTGEYTFDEAIRLITGNRQLIIDLVGEYVLLRMPEQPDVDRRVAVVPQQRSYFTVGGVLVDEDTDEAILSASVSLVNTSIGTITNRDGVFQLVVPDSLRGSKVRFSHVGYESREIELNLMEGRHIRFALKPQVIVLQEVVVNAVNPMVVLEDMLSQRSVNYMSDPVYLTVFYREGIDSRQQHIDLTESVLEVYKTGYLSSSSNDQVKLIKKRRIVNRQEIDTILPKMKSGVNSCLMLDIIKELPEFLQPEKSSPYIYAHTGINLVDGRPADVIFFRQKEFVYEPLYKGELFIERENKALAEVHFELNPDLVGKATPMFVDRKTAKLRIDLQEAKYLISYKRTDDGRYFINHIRGDVTFKVRKRRQLFSTPLHFWFEMITCKIDKEEVEPFPRNMRLSPTRIFAETKHGYDRSFWENFNVILPEEDLQQAILHSLNDVLINESMSNESKQDWQ